MKPRRSTVYVTEGDRESRVRELVSGSADVILLDLEDGVAPSNKPHARKVIRKILQEFDFNGKERLVRINDVRSEHYPLDMAEVIAPGLPDAVRVPKCETPADVLKVDADLREIEQKANLPENTIEIWAMIETPLGIRNAYDIAVSCPRVTALTIGMQDLNSSMGIVRRYINNEHDLLYARQKFVLDAKAAGVQALDTVLLTSDDEINCAYTIASKEMGFDGRAVHSEREAQFANATYYPSPELLDWAENIVAAYKEAEKDGRPCLYDGKVICFAVFKQAESILAMKR